MLTFATSLINGAELWKVILASLIGGAGVAIAFGLAILGAELSQSDKGGERVAGFGLATVCGLFCLAAVVIGLIAMIDKPASKPAPAPKSAAVQVQRPTV